MKLKTICFLSLTCAVFACSSEQKENQNVDESNIQSEVKQLVVNTDTIPEIVELKNVLYYYNLYVKNEDSEDPSVGVTPRKIISQDLKNGIITFKSGGDSQLKRAQLFHLDGFDLFDHPGNYLLIQGEKSVAIDMQEEPMELAMKVAGARSARGGECEYNENPILKVLKNKLCIIMNCLDDDNFEETIGYITMKNGKMKVVEL